MGAARLNGVLANLTSIAAGRSRNARVVLISLATRAVSIKGEPNAGGAWRLEG